MKKNLKTALIRPPEVNPYWTKPKPSLGIGYLAAFLNSKKFNCKIFDAVFNNWNDEELVGKICEYSPDLVGISAMTHEICKADKVAGDIRNKCGEIPIVIGGCHVTAIPHRTLEEFSNFSIGVIGEGEVTMLELAEKLHKDEIHNLDDVKGIVYRNSDGGIVKTETKNVMSSEDLNELPYPSFDQYYGQDKPLSAKGEYYVLMTSRGCPYNCAFCMQVLGRKVRRRTAESVVKEMAYAVEKYGAHSIYFLDEVFLFNNKLTYESLDLIRKERLHEKVKWRALTRVNFVDDKLIEAAKQSGCFALEIGIESGNNEILKSVNKMITIEQAEKAVAIIKKHRIHVEANFIIGHPNETEETVKDTINLAAKLNPSMIAIGIMTPYPGTKIYEMAKNGECGYRLLTEDWSKYDKYGGRALELREISFNRLEKWQRKGLLIFYLRNFRIIDLIRFVLKNWKVIVKLVVKKK